MTIRAVAIGALWTVACGGGGDAPQDASALACKQMGGAVCFQLPTAPLSTRDGSPSALGCGPIVPMPAPTPVTFTGSVLSFGTSKPIPDTTIKLYSSADFTTPIATATSQQDATYSIQVPAGTPDVLWGFFAAAEYLDIYPHAVRVNLANGDIPDFTLRMITADNIESAALLVKEIWDTTNMTIAGNVYDCNRMVVMHAAVALSTTSGSRSFIAGASLYYGAPGVVPLAVPPDQGADTSDNGAFAVFRVPNGKLYLQAWGFVDAAAQARGEAGLTLIGEQPVHGVANAVANVAIWAK